MVNPITRVTKPTLRVLEAFLENPAEEHYGLDLVNKTPLQSRTIYSVLERLESSGWLEARWENDNTKSKNRPPRRYYRLTQGGKRQAIREIEKTRNSTTATISKPEPDFDCENTTFSPNIRFRVREDSAVFYKDHFIGKSKFEIEVNPDSPADIELFNIYRVGLEEENPAESAHFLINGVDHLENTKLEKQKETIDLVNEIKIIQIRRTIPSNLFAKSGNTIHLESTAKYRRKFSRHPCLEFVNFYATDEFSVKLESQELDIRPSYTNYLLAETDTIVTSRNGIGDSAFINIKKSELLSEDVKFKNNIITWKPKDLIRGASNFLHIEAN